MCVSNKHVSPQPLTFLPKVFFGVSFVSSASAFRSVGRLQPRPASCTEKVVKPRPKRSASSSPWRHFTRDRIGLGQKKNGEKSGWNQRGVCVDFPLQYLSAYSWNPMSCHKLCFKMRDDIWRFPQMGVTPKSSIWIGFSLINHPRVGTLIKKRHQCIKQKSRLHQENK